MRTSDSRHARVKVLLGVAPAAREVVTKIGCALLAEIRRELAKIAVRCFMPLHGRVLGLSPATMPDHKTEKGTAETLRRETEDPGR